MTKLEREILNSAIQYARTSFEMPVRVVNARKVRLQQLVDEYLTTLASTKAIQPQGTGGSHPSPSGALAQVPQGKK